MIKNILFTGLFLMLIVSCSKEDTENEPEIILNFDFQENTEDWTGGFADYPVGDSVSFDLLFQRTTLPSPLNETKGALKLSGTNMSDDLFMFALTKIEGLNPQAQYDVTFTVEFASNVPDDQVGVGGSPGESVWIKAGAVPEKPVPQEDDMGYYRMNIDKGAQSQGGKDMRVLGDFSNDTDQSIYTLKTVQNETVFTTFANAMGELWIIVGTDSGFEATTTIYYNHVKVLLREK